MFLVYALLVHVAFVILLPVLLVHPKLREGFLCRLGFYLPRWPGTAKRRASGHVFWFHGASAGDLAGLDPRRQAFGRPHRHHQWPLPRAGAAALPLVLPAHRQPLQERRSSRHDA